MNQKFKELIKYIAEKSEGDQRFGATKLNKILFFSDITAYVETGEPITGEVYQYTKNGPAPKHLIRAREELLEDREIAIKKEFYYGQTQHRIVALEKPNLEKFSGEEIAVVDRVIDKLKDQGANGVSNISQDSIFWEAFDERQEIPYESVFVSSEEPTEEMIEYGRELAKDYGK